MDPLIVNNLGEEAVIIQGQTIDVEGNYIVPSENILTWAKDAYLRLLLADGIIDIDVFGIELSSGQNGPADIWLQRVASGNIVYA